MEFRKGNFLSGNQTLMIASSEEHSLSIEEEEMLAVRSSDPGLAGLVPVSSFYLSEERCLRLPHGSLRFLLNRSGQLAPKV